MSLSECRLLGRLVRWRIPGTPRDITYRELFRAEPFVLLEEGDTSSVSGLCGQIWTLRRDYPPLDGPSAFAEWQAPASVRVLFAHWVEPVDDLRAALASEVHIEATDAAGRRGVRLVRPLISAFERLIDSEPLAIAAEAAQAQRGTTS